ncbi:MAG: hypothetical protein GXO61_02575 [Epsilonproteobacteria bacterium]|nr:hypothetical protein [Campylobacterota bacterium]
MRKGVISLILVGTLYASFAPNSDCKSCHPTIWEEFQTSQHANANIFKDPIHAAVWKKHPKSKKNAYTCAKCHTPAANNLEELMAPNGVGPDPKNPTQNDSVACAYCHRIKAIREGLVTNTNIISPTPKHYFGTRKDHIKSPYHEIDTSNPNFLKGNVCMGCHSHKRNRFGLNVCSTNENREIENSNCTRCHMPKVKGSVSTLRETKTHTFHGFPGAHVHNKMLRKYVDIEFLPYLKSFEIALNSKLPHDLLLHPARVAFLKVKVIRDGKEVFKKQETLVRVIGADGKPTPPWLAKEVVKDTMLKANEKRVFEYRFQLQPKDKVVAILGYKLVKPPLAKKLGLNEEPIATSPFILKKRVFEVE